MITYHDLYLSVRRKLKQSSNDGADQNARELVCFGSGKTREELLRDARLYVSQDVVDEVESLVLRHLRGEPVAYILGEWEFYGIGLDINESVLIPRSDTETLVDEAIAALKGRGPCRVLDLCAGSGCIGIALATHLPLCRVVLGDVSEPAVRLCRQNIRRTGLSTRASAVTLDALAPPPKSLGEFDCLACNPPYIPDADVGGLDISVRDYEPRLALCGGVDGLDFYRAILAQWKGVLADNGLLFFEVGAGQADAVFRLMRSAGFGDINVTPDPQGIPRVVYGSLFRGI